MEHYWTSGMTQEMSLLTLMNIGSSSVEINLITCQMCPESLSMKETQLTWEHRNLYAVLPEVSKSRGACSEFTIVRNPRVSLRSDYTDSQSLLFLGYSWNCHSILRKLSANSLWKAQWNKCCLCATLVERTLYPKEKNTWKLYHKRKARVEPQCCMVLLAQRVNQTEARKKKW